MVKLTNKMKYILTLLTVVTFSFANAQQVDFSDGSINYNDEEVQTIDVKLDPKVGTIKDKFGDWMDENYDVNLDGKKLLFFNKEYMTANGVVVPQISSNQIDIKVKVDESQDGLTLLNVFASFGYNNWIDEEDHPYEYAALRGIVLDFVQDYLPEYYFNKIQDTTDKIAEIKDDKAKLEKDMANNDEEISKLLEENRELMDKIKSNQERLKSAKQKLSLRNQDYKTIKKKVSNIDKTENK